MMASDQLTVPYLPSLSPLSTSAKWGYRGSAPQLWGTSAGMMEGRVWDRVDPGTLKSPVPSQLCLQEAGLAPEALVSTCV